MHSSNLIRNEESVYEKIIPKLDQNKQKIKRINREIIKFRKDYEQLLKDDNDYVAAIEEYHYVIDHLIRSISFLTEERMTTCPTSHEVLENPELLQRVIQHSYNYSMTSKKACEVEADIIVCFSLAASEAKASNEHACC